MLLNLNMHANSFFFLHFLMKNAKTNIFSLIYTKIGVFFSIFFNKQTRKTCLFFCKDKICRNNFFYIMVEYPKRFLKTLGHNALQIILHINLMLFYYYLLLLFLLIFLWECHTNTNNKKMDFHDNYNTI